MSKLEDDDSDLYDRVANAASGVSGDYDTSIVADPYDFVFKHARTLDPHDKANPIKPFPDHPYLRDILKCLLEKDRIVIEKSRQMQATWLAVIFGLWMAMSRKGAMVFFVSRKEDDAGFARPLSLLTRADFVYRHLPEHMQIPAKRGLKPPILEFPRQFSSIMGLTQDSDALRQYTSTYCLCDEWAFQEKARQSYSAMMPTLQGGGKLVGISTPNGRANLFYDITHDETDL